jgi:competence protein ComEA
LALPRRRYLSGATLSRERWAMKQTIVLIGIAGLVAIAIWRPVAQAPITIASPPAAGGFAPRTHHRSHVAAAAAGQGTSLIYVVGAVRRPGLYRVAPDGRIDDAIRAAGGLSPGADPAGVNLAARVSDGDEIAVPRIGETPRATSRLRRSRTARTHRKTKSHAIVDVNTADAAQLATVPGIGATIAARIVTVREQEGAFTTFDELLDVAGMTQSRLDRMQPYLRL